MIDDARLALHQEPVLATTVQQVMDEVAQRAEPLALELLPVMMTLENKELLEYPHLSLYITGHSLGASAVSIALGMHCIEQPATRFCPPCLFESPGVPEQLLRAMTLRAEQHGRQNLLNAIREGTTEVLGAPNPINMLHEHFGQIRMRVKVPHGQPNDAMHLFRCAMGSASRMALPFTVAWATARAAVGLGASAGALATAPTTVTAPVPYILGIYNSPSTLGASAATAPATVTATVTATASAVARSLHAAAVVSNTLGIREWALWTLRQHSIDNLYNAFDIYADEPRNFQRVGQWPTNATMVNMAKRLVVSHIPFHPTNHGLHTLNDPDEVVEGRISSMVGYSIL